ncbi:hypothetical protein CLU79DRAFT_834816 [Phycomyces nitens]|nr:hypothetical protein CLU79DRAFT_834816 [Phycomyces nitens]
MGRQSRQAKLNKQLEGKVRIQLNGADLIKGINPQALQESRMEQSSSVDENAKLKEIPERKIRGVYTKNSRTTLWRKRKASELAKQAKASIKIQHNIPNSETKREVQTESSRIQREDTENGDEDCIKSSEVASITAVYQELVEKAVPRIAETGPEIFANTYEHFRHASLRQYFYHLLNGMRKVKASETATFEIWGKMTTYRPKAIRKWAIEYLATGTLVPRKQGQHTKSTSLSSTESEADTA